MEETNNNKQNRGVTSCNDQYRYVPDDVSVCPIPFSPSESESSELVSVDDLQHQAELAQRLVVSRLSRKYVRGSMASAYVDEEGMKWTPEKMFRVNKLVEWVSGSPDVVVDALAAGRLRCRLSARMGLGKSTSLSFYVARALDYRVLHVGLDAHALQQMSIYVAQSGIGRISRQWSTARKASVSCMTYADFCGYMATARRSQLFKSFDLLLFDEAFYQSAEVFVAKRCFAAYSPPDTNLILCSATIRTDSTSDDVSSQGLGQFKEIDRHISVQEAISSGKLVSDYLVDRTLVLVPHDQDVYALQRHYVSAGVDVKILDEASLYEELRAAESWLLDDSTTPRVLVAHSTYHIGFNFAVAYSIIFPYEASMRVTDRVISIGEEPMVSESVSQAKSRTGRGIVDGSGGIVMAPDRSEIGELKESEKMAAFVMLCASSIEPLRNDFWKVPFDLFPDGINPTIAHTLLKVCLPIQLVTHYLGKDGRFVSRYCAALNVFSQPDHFLIPSDTVEPPGKVNWIEQELIGASKHEMIKVPMHTSGELQIVVHAIEMLACNRIRVPRWRPTRGFALDDGYDSEDEAVDSRYKPTSSVTLRRVEESTYRRVEAPVVKQIPWTYRPEQSASAPRLGGYIDSARCKEALLELEQNIRDYRVPELSVVEVVETSEGSAVPVAGTADVESPGGSVVCTIPVKLAEKLNRGIVLSPDEMVKLVDSARRDIDRFVGSKLFDCLSGSWDSVLDSLMEPDVAAQVVVRGLASDTYAIVDSMRGRFSVELCSVIAASNVFKKTYWGLFSKFPSVDKVMRAIRDGKFDAVAQTSGFIARVKDIKVRIDRVLVNAERSNVFLPTHITRAQRSLPLRGESVVGYVGDGISAMPSSWRKKLTSPTTPEREKRHLVNNPDL